MLCVFISIEILRFAQNDMYLMVTKVKGR